MALRDKCYNDLGSYYLALNPSYDYVEFQQERIVPVLEGVECGDIDRLMIFMPAGHSKTQLATKAFIPWYLGRNPKENVILLCHTQPLAKDFGSDIRNTMAKNEAHRQVFPDVRVDNSNHAADFFKLNKGGAFYAFGMDGGMTGRRADCLPAETLVETDQGRFSIADLVEKFPERRTLPKILSYNPESNTTEFRQIQAVKCVGDAREFVYLRTRSGCAVTATPDHRVWSVDRNAYVPIGGLFLGERMMVGVAEYVGSSPNTDSATHQIKCLEFVRAKRRYLPDPVYDLQVEGTRNFFANNILVHNCIIIDDPIKSLEDALSDTVQNVLYGAYKAVIKDRLRPNGKMVMVVTRWAQRDLAARILADEGDRWKVLVLKAQEEEPDGPYLWESFYGRKHYEEQKRDTFIWNAKWQQIPEPRLMKGFSEEWLHFYTPQDVEKLSRYNAYIFVDPAMGKTAAHDRSAILVVVAGPEKKCFLMDAVLDRLDPTERIDQLVRLTRIWSPKLIFYEEFALTADTHFMRKRFDDEGLNETPIISLGRGAVKGMGAKSGGRLPKDERIYSWLAPAFRDGLIWFPKKMVRKLQDGSDFDIISYAINREFLPYAGEGSIENDDFLDCLSRIYDPNVSLTHVESGKQLESYDNYADSGGWESRF